MRPQNLTRALAILCLLVAPLSVGLIGCKKKPPSDSSASPETKESPKKKLPSKHDTTLHGSPMGGKDLPVDSMGSTRVMDKGFADPAKPSNVPPHVGEKPPETRDGGTIRDRGHKGMLPMKGLVDPAD